MTSLTGKIIVVTGAGRGLGRAFAEGAAKAGAAAVVVAELVEEWGRATVAALQKSMEAGRERFSWLVSRNTVLINESELRESAI